MSSICVSICFHCYDACPKIYVMERERSNLFVSINLLIMAFTLGSFMPKTMLKLPTFKTYQQPRKGIVIVCSNPTPPGGSTGGGGKINSEKPTSLRNAQIVVKETPDKDKAAKEDDSAKNKSIKASN